MSVTLTAGHDYGEQAESTFLPRDGHWENTGTKGFYRQDHGALLLGKLASLRKDSILSDVVLKTACGSTFHCHRVVLAASSLYFKALFTSGMSDSRTGEIDLQNIPDACLATLLDYIYTGEIKISQDTAQDLAEAAGFLQLLDIQQLCFKFLGTQLDASNTFDVEHVADRLFSRQLSQHARQFSADNFMEIAVSPEFYHCTKEEVGDLLIRELQVDCEEQVYEAIMRWVRRDVQDRITALPELLENVAFEVMPTPYLTNILGKETLLEDNSECAGIVAKVRTAAMKRDTQTGAPEQPKIRSDQPKMRKLKHPRNYSEVVVVFRNTRVESGTISSDEKTVLRSSILQYDPAHHKWEDLPSMPLKSMYEFPVSVATIQNNVIVITNKYRTWMYQSHHKAWSLLAREHPPRNGACLVSTGTDAYLLGGCSPVNVAPVASVLRFDGHIQQWKETTKMPISLTHVTGVCCQGNVYAIGSKSTSHFVSEMLCFHPTARIWKDCATIPIKLMRTQAVAIQGYIYILGQRNDFTLDLCRYDTNKDTWDEMEGPLIARVGASTVVCNNKIYLIGGQSLKGDYMEQEENTVETFDPQDGVWRIHSGMQLAVSGHPATTILHPNHSPSRFLGPKQH